MGYATTGRLGRMGIIKESVYGTFVTPDKQISITKEDYKKKIEFETDNRLINKIAPSDFIAVGEVVEGSIDLTVHPEEIGPMLNLAMMKNNASATAPRALLLIVYVGTNAYASATYATTTLTLKSGASQGTAVAQVTLDLSLPANNTAAEAAAAITAAHVDWKAYAHGYGAAVHTELTTYTETEITGHFIVMPYVPATAKKLHYISPAGATDAEVSFSSVTDRVIGTNKCLSVAGGKVNTMSMSIEARKLVNMNVGLVGRLESTGVTYPSISSLSDKPYIAGNAVVYLNGIRVDVVKNLSIAISNNLDISGLVGSALIQEPIRQGLTISVNGTMNMNAAEWERYYPIFGAGSNCEMMIYIENAGYADLTLNVKEYILIRIAGLTLKTYDSMLTGPNRLTTSFTAEGHEAGSYDPIGFWVVDLATSAY